MRSRLFNVAAAVSLVLLVATVVMWVRSYHVEEWWSARNARRDTRAGSNLGRVVLWRIDFAPPTARTRPFNYHAIRPPQDRGFLPFERLDVFVRLPGLRFHDGVGVWGPPPVASGRARLIILSLAWPTAIFGLLPLAWAWRSYAHRRRIVAGRCSACGYDLRATPGRCPECGTVPDARAESAAQARAAQGCLGATETGIANTSNFITEGRDS